jgi:hypothetical protein
MNTFLLTLGALYTLFCIGSAISMGRRGLLNGGVALGWALWMVGFLLVLILSLSPLHLIWIWIVAQFFAAQAWQRLHRVP